jgi:hypothetical protein
MREAIVFKDIEKPIDASGEGWVEKLFNENELLEIHEIYLSVLGPFQKKSWRKHRRLTCNLYVVSGSIEFCYQSPCGTIKSFICRAGRKSSMIRIEPEVWFAFENKLSENAVIINGASSAHDPSEIEYR